MMSVSRQNWLQDALQLTGVQAAALLAPDRAPLSASNTTAWTEALLAPVWRHVADTVRVSAHHRLPAQEMRWIFERVLVYCQRRTDGMMFAIVVERDPDHPFDAAAAEQLFEEFRNARDV